MGAWAESFKGLSNVADRNAINVSFIEMRRLKAPVGRFCKTPTYVCPAGGG